VTPVKLLQAGGKLKMQEYMEEQYVYDAYICYRHTEFDTNVAKVLHRELESYRFPKNFNYIEKQYKHRRIFRDIEELPSSSSLTDSIGEALKKSRYLIVICSPRTPQSNWINMEISMFINLGRANKILVLLIDGSYENSIPPQLYNRPHGINEQDNRIEEEPFLEPLAADIRANSQKESLWLLKREKLRLIAAIYGCQFDDLMQRTRKRSVKRIFLLLLTFMTGAIIVTGLIYQFKLLLEKDSVIKQLKEQIRDATKVNYPQFSQDGKMLARIDGKSVRIYDADSGDLLVTLDNGEEIVYSNFSPDGVKIFTTSVSGEIKIWDIKSGRLISTIK
jgi:hypothetical protein